MMNYFEMYPCFEMDPCFHMDSKRYTLTSQENMNTNQMTHNTKQQQQQTYKLFIITILN